MVAEARWRRSQMDVGYLNEIEAFKLPALRQSKLKVASEVRIVLACLGGYSEGLHELAAERPDIVLVDVVAALAGDPHQATTQ